MHEYPIEGLEERTAIEKEYVLKDMHDLIDSLDIPEHKKKNGLKSFKNIINRAYITGREAHTLKGILRRLKMKIDKQWEKLALQTKYICSKIYFQLEILNN